MVLMGVHVAIGKQSDEMQLTATRASTFYRVEQDRIGEDRAVLDHYVNLGDVHVHDAAGAHIEVADFAVAHLAVRQTYKAPAGVNERVGILAQQLVVSGLASESDGVGLALGAIAPTIEDDEDERLGFGHLEN